MARRRGSALTAPSAAEQYRCHREGDLMDFGIFTEQIRRGSSQGDWFRELFELADAGEEWGLDVVWLAEMMVNPARSALSAPLLVASWIVARTRRLRVGTAVQLLPL